MTLKTSKTARRKYVAALRVARRRIESHEERLVCYALPTNKAGLDLRQWIRNGIGHNVTVETWLREKLRISIQSATKRRAYRLAWIDHMIAYFKDDA